MMTIAQKISAAGYTAAYLMGKGRKAPTKAARVNSQIAAFIEAFVNGSWTNYFNPAIAESRKWYLLETHDDWAMAPPQANAKIRNDALINVSIGALDYMLSNPKINEIKNVLHQARTNPQTA